VYLCHLIPIQLLQGSSALSDHPGVRALLAVVGTVILAAVATKYVEIPLDKYRQKRVHVRARVKSDLGISALPQGTHYRH
jgi:peptidoglycan/LPS O-acetylase OafA/YrhL